MFQHILAAVFGIFVSVASFFHSAPPPTVVQTNVASSSTQTEATGTSAANIPPIQTSANIIQNSTKPSASIQNDATPPVQKTQNLITPSGAVIDPTTGEIIYTPPQSPQAPESSAQLVQQSNNKQSLLNSELQSCTSQINSINQQIQNAENAYYQQVAAISKSPIPLEDQQGQAALALSKEEQQVATLQLQGGQIETKCQNELNQLEQ